MIYLVIVNNTDDYSVSWTGNYRGFSSKCYGAFTNEDEALDLAELFEEAEVRAIPLNKIDTDGEEIYPIITFIQGMYKNHSDDY